MERLGQRSAAAIVGAPGRVSRAEHVVDVYVRGAGNAIYQRYVDRRRRLERLGASVDATPVDSSPAAGGDGPDHEWLFARAGTRTWSARSGTRARGWTAWDDFGPIAVPPPRAAPRPAPAPRRPTAR